MNTNKLADGNNIEVGQLLKGIISGVIVRCEDVRTDKHFAGTIIKRGSRHDSNDIGHFWCSWSIGEFNLHEPAPSPEKKTASDILDEASSTIKQRGEERDKGSERSIKSTVEAFNALTGQSMTETQGWQFMVILKLARANGGDFKLDDYLDGAAYMALAGECELNAQNE